MNIYLIGFMGSGKSTYGRKAASSLRWKYADIDKLVEESEGMTVTEIFASKGESHFRVAESNALRRISEGTRTVVSCGGGTPCSEENISLMKSTGVTVYLKLSVEDLVSRLRRSGMKRPLLKGVEPGGLAGRIEEMLHERSRWYEKADLVIDAGKSGEDEMTAIIAEAVRAKGAFL